MVELCTRYAKAESELKEQQLRVKNYWIRTDVQLKFVQSIAHTLDEEHQEIQCETVEMLASKLKIAVDRIKSVTKSKSSCSEEVQVKRVKYVVLQQKIEKAVQDLEHWQRMFDPSWYLIMKAATPQIDAELKTCKLQAVATAADSHAPISSAQSLRSALASVSTIGNEIRVFLRKDSLESVQLHNIPLCSARVGRRQDPDKLPIILDQYKPSPEVNIKQLQKDVRDFARKLAHSSALEFGFLNCKGVIKENPDGLTAFTFVFRVPLGFTQPRSLRSCFQDGRGTDSLSDRFKLANELARSVSYVHTFGFVHKNIRPETILLLSGKESSISSAFLIGFDSFRTAEGRTLRKGDSAWERCLYQHPSRMGSMAAADYIMQHDIYSLGVCLLELGLWNSFVVYDDQELSLPAAGDSEGTNATQSSILGTDLPQSSFKDRLLSLARGELRSRMGTRYSEIVVTCLTCLDPGNIDFGDESEFQDEDGIQVGVRYIEKVSVQEQHYMAE